MSQWKEVIIDDIALVRGGKRLPKGDELINDITKHPYIRARDIKNGKINFNDPKYLSEATFLKLKNYTISTGDILVTIVGANIGDVAYVHEVFNNANLTENAIKISLKEESISSKFLFYLLFLDTRKKYFQLVASGAAQDKLGIYKIKKTPLSIPDLQTQKKIAKTLSNYDDLIENNLKQIELLEEKARLTYEEWFLRFRVDGVKLEIDEVSGLPFGWERKRADEVIDVNIGKTPPRVETQWFTSNNKGVKWISIKDMKKTNNYIFDSNEEITLKGITKHNMNIAKSGTVILSFKLTVGEVRIVTENMVTNEAIAHMNIKEDSILFEEYIYLYLKSFNFDTLGSTSSIGTAINSKIVKGMPIVLPNLGVLNKFKNLILPILKEIKNLQQQNQNLKEARDILLPRLMSGVIEP